MLNKMLCRITQVFFFGMMVTQPAQAQLEDRIVQVSFVSQMLNREKAYSVVLPDGYDRQKTDWPVLFLFHGRGRHERSLTDDVVTRNALLKVPFVVVLPDGDDGWYIDSPVKIEDQYEAYAQEVITHATERFMLSTAAAKRGLSGWSMGGYGCIRFAQTHSQAFSAVASMIGLLDFPRNGLPKGQSYKVPIDRFGENPDVWTKLNPMSHIEKLKGMALLIVTADRAFDRTMNQNFSTGLNKANITHQWQVLKGGHTFSVVRQAVPLVLDFMTKHLCEKTSGDRSSHH